jgi:hypothetical protein
MLDLAKNLFDLLNPKFLIENIYLFSVLSLFLVVYGPRLHPALPPTLRSLFDNAMFRALVLFLIAYIAHRDFAAALTISIVFMVTMNILHSTNVLESIATKLHMENFETYGPAVANCTTYKQEDRQKLGNSFYPLNTSDIEVTGNKENEYAETLKN